MLDLSKRVLEMARLAFEKGGAERLTRDEQAVLMRVRDVPLVDLTPLMAELTLDFFRQLGAVAPDATWPDPAERYGVEYSRSRATHDPGTHAMISAIVPLLVELVAPTSVADVGCGLGQWLKAFTDRGVSRVLGFDVAPAPADLLEIPEARRLVTDVRKPLETAERTDLAICLMVGECMPPEHAPQLVRNCTKLAPAVCFASATPMLNGPRPWVHEAWPSFWAGLFKAEGYVALDVLREPVWNDPRVLPSYSQAMILYVTPELHKSHPRLSKVPAVADLGLLDRVHPRKLLELGFEMLVTASELTAGPAGPGGPGGGPGGPGGPPG